MKFLLSSLLLALLISCASRRITTIWKADSVFANRYQKILVIAILPERDSLLRAALERECANSLTDLGYNAISANTVYGSKGLTGPGESATYLKLCESGIDAVMILALAPDRKDDHYPGTGAYIHSDNYYYSRIWQFKEMQDVMINNTPDDEYFWESILFDLSTLQAVSTIRTKSFSKEEQEQVTEQLVKLTVKKMVKEGIVKNRNINRKAF